MMTAKSLHHLYLSALNENGSKNWPGSMVHYQPDPAWTYWIVPSAFALARELGIDQSEVVRIIARTPELRG